MDKHGGLGFRRATDMKEEDEECNILRVISLTLDMKMHREIMNCLLFSRTERGESKH